ncbi:MAG TPA: hypothetical protein VIJ94_09350 [Caulobacteraceae bacterium]
MPPDTEPAWEYIEVLRTQQAPAIIGRAIFPNAKTIMTMSKNIGGRMVIAKRHLPASYKFSPYIVGYVVYTNPFDGAVHKTGFCIWAQFDPSVIFDPNSLAEIIVPPDKVRPITVGNGWYAG